MKHVLFTNEGFITLKIKLEEEIEKRPDAVKTLSRAREMGDLSENGLYKAARFELSQIDRQIRFLKNLIKYSKVVGPINNTTVQIGHNVIIESKNGEKEYQIVGEYEANPKMGKISHKSPIGIQLMGKKSNEVVSIVTPNAVTEYKIKSIAK